MFSNKSMKSNLVLDLIIPQNMHFQKLQKKLSKLVTLENMLVGYSLIYIRHLILWIMISLKKLNHCGIRGIAQQNVVYKHYLISHSQRELKCGVPHGSNLGPVLFILFINNLHKNVEFSTYHNFADNTNMLLIEKSLKKLNKHINRKTWNFVVEWIMADKLPLNTSKTELVIFKSRNKTIMKHLTVVTFA